MSSHLISILIAGGGTGGHLWPGISLADALMASHPNTHVSFLVPGRPVDITIMNSTNYPWYRNPMRSVPAWDKLPQFVAAFMRGMLITRHLFHVCQPDVVVGLGGYGSLSSGLLARHYQIPLVMLESNAVAGKVVRWMANWSSAVYSGGEVKGIPCAKMKILGIPIRSDLPVAKPCVYNGDVLTVLVMGGSQGARCINQAMNQAAPLLCAVKHRIKIIHLCGNQEREIAQVYAQHGITAQVMPFVTDMSSLYRRTDLIVCRAGGSTLAEIQAIGLPAVLVPFARAAENHQKANADRMVHNGAAVVIEETELNGARIAEVLQQLVANPQRLCAMASQARAMGKPDAASAIAQDIFTMLGVADRMASVIRPEVQRFNGEPLLALRS